MISPIAYAVNAIPNARYACPKTAERPYLVETINEAIAQVTMLIVKT
jgi:hypothetical protein